MTIAEAGAKMREIAAAAAEKFKEYGFEARIDTDYYNHAFNMVKKPERARYISVVLIIGEEKYKEIRFNGYQLMMAVEVKARQVEESELEKSRQEFDAMIEETVTFLDGYEDKNEGLKVLRDKAAEDLRKSFERMEEEYQKSRKTALIGNIAFIVGLAILLIVAVVRSLYGS